MVNISKLGDSTIKFTFTDNDRYLYNGEITLPLNSLILEFDTSDLVIFKKIDGDVFVTFLLENSNFNSKAELESWYKANMVSSGGGGGGVTPEEVEEMIDEAVSGKQDTLIAGENITISGNVISSQGGGDIVDTTAIPYMYSNRFEDPYGQFNATAFTLDYLGDKQTSTYEVCSVTFADGDNNLITVECYLNYSAGTYTKNDDYNIVTIVYDSSIADFKFTTNPSYFLREITFYGGYIKMPSGMEIASGETADVIETSIADYLGDLYTRNLNNVNQAQLSWSAKDIRFTAYKNNARYEGQTLNLDELVINNDTLKPDINISLGTSGWTEVDLSQSDRFTLEFLGSPLPFTKFRMSGYTGELQLWQLMIGAGYNNNYNFDTVYWDAGQNTFLMTTNYITGASLNWDAQNGILTVEYPPTVTVDNVEYQTKLYYVTSTQGQFNNSITMFEYYGENILPIKPYVQLLKTDVDTLSGQVSSKISTSAVTTAVTSGSTDAEIPTAKAVYDAIGQGGGGGTDAPISAGTGTDSVKENYVNNVASGEYSHAEGRGTSASGNSSHAEGNGTSAKGNYAHAEGQSTVASGDSSHAEGQFTNANGSNSHAEGSNTKANGSNSHAEGKYSQASGQTSHAEGDNTRANGIKSHAEGGSTVANGSNSHAEGSNTIANNESEHASGKYNVSNTGESTSAQTLFSVGNGGWDETAQDVVRHNAFEVRQNGDIYLNNGTSDVKLQDYIQIKVVKLTQQEYDALSPNYDNNTLYVIS